MARATDPTIPKISLFDIFIGKGRTIRHSPGPPGLPLLQARTIAPRAPPKTPPAAAIEPAAEPTPNKDSGTKEGDHKPAWDGKNDGAAFTSEQDAKLLAMKAESKSWKQIAGELHKAPGHLKTRFKELQQQTGAGKEETAAKEPAISHHSNEDEKYEQRRHNYEHRSHKHRSHEQQSLDHQSRPPGTIASSTGTGWYELKEDDLFSFDELQALIEILEADGAHLWDRVASKFYNRTGRRILPADIMKKMSGGR